MIEQYLEEASKTTFEPKALEELSDEHQNTLQYLFLEIERNCDSVTGYPIKAKLKNDGGLKLIKEEKQVYFPENTWNDLDIYRINEEYINIQH